MSHPDVRRDWFDDATAGDSAPDVDHEWFPIDRDPQCIYVVTYRPTVDETEHDRAVFEWILEWFDCPDVIEVDVEYPERNGASVTVEIESVADCHHVGETAHHERVLDELESIGRLEWTDCRPVIPAMALE